MTESDRTNKLCGELRKCNAEIFIATTPRSASAGSSALRWAAGTPGWPDRYICHTLWHGWLEFKLDAAGAATGSARLAPLQANVVRALNKRQPGCAYVVRHGVNRIEDCDGGVLAHFDGTGVDLLRTLSLLQG